MHARSIILYAALTYHILNLNTTSALKSPSIIEATGGFFTEAYKVYYALYKILGLWLIKVSTE